jgi:hypothetical protein
LTRWDISIYKQFMDANKTNINSTYRNLASCRSTRPPAAWSAASAETLIELWNGGHSAAEIATRLGVSARAVESKLSKLRAAGHELVWRRASVAVRVGRARRRCLHCGEMFASEHLGNRICLVTSIRGGYWRA